MVPTFSPLFPFIHIHSFSFPLFFSKFNSFLLFYPISWENCFFLSFLLISFLFFPNFRLFALFFTYLSFFFYSFFSLFQSNSQEIQWKKSPEIKFVHKPNMEFRLIVFFFAANCKDWNRCHVIAAFQHDMYVMVKDEYAVHHILFTSQLFSICEFF